MIENCSFCLKMIDTETNASTTCSNCDHVFCGSLGNNCYINHHKKSSCKGKFRTILDPQWIVNLRVVENNARQ